MAVLEILLLLSNANVLEVTFSGFLNVLMIIIDFSKDLWKLFSLHRKQVVCPPRISLHLTL